MRRCTGRVTGLEDFDGAHRLPTGRTSQPVGGRQVISVVIDIVVGHDMEQCTGLGEVLCTPPIGGQPVMTDTVESTRQNVEEEPADEHRCVERHGLITMVLLGAVVLPLEGDALVVASDET